MWRSQKKLEDSLSPDNLQMYYALMAEQGRAFRKIIEAISAVSSLVFGLMLLSSGYKSWGDIFVPMELVAPAFVWGAVALILSTIRLTIIIINGWWPYSHTVRKYLSIGYVFLLWLPLTACVILSFVVDIMDNNMHTYPSLAYSVFVLGVEFLIFYAHTSFVYAIKRG